jgi:hypothetical protein
LNLQPADYKSAALPLSYASFNKLEKPRRPAMQKLTCWPSNLTPGKSV